MSPRAWSAAGIIHMSLGNLGLVPDMRTNSLKLINPVLPEGLNEHTVRGLHVLGKEFILTVKRRKNMPLEVSAFDSKGNKLKVLRNQAGSAYKIELAPEPAL